MKIYKIEGYYVLVDKQEHFEYNESFKIDRLIDEINKRMEERDLRINELHNKLREAEQEKKYMFETLFPTESRKLKRLEEETVDLQRRCNEALSAITNSSY